MLQIMIHAIILFIVAFAIGWLLRITVFAKTKGSGEGFAFGAALLSWPVLVLVETVFLEVKLGVLIVGNNAASVYVGMTSIAFAFGLFEGVKRKDQLK